MSRNKKKVISESICMDHYVAFLFWFILNFLSFCSTICVFVNDTEGINLCDIFSNSVQFLSNRNVGVFVVNQQNFNGLCFNKLSHNDPMASQNNSFKCVRYKNLKLLYWFFFNNYTHLELLHEETWNVLTFHSKLLSYSNVFFK